MVIAVAVAVTAAVDAATVVAVAVAVAAAESAAVLPSRSLTVCLIAPHCCRCRCENVECCYNTVGFSSSSFLAMCGQGQSLLKGGRAHYPVFFFNSFLPTLTELVLPSEFSGFVGHSLVKGCLFLICWSGGGKGIFFGQKETCWSGDKQGRSKQDKKRNVDQVMVRRWEVEVFFGICWFARAQLRCSISARTSGGLSAMVAAFDVHAPIRFGRANYLHDVIRTLGGESTY